MQIHEKLKKDCHLIVELEHSHLLLRDDAYVCWFILVPKTDAVEWADLDLSLQHKLLDEINQTARYIQANYHPDKLNIASLGNIVEQLHIHVIGRKYDDPYWPDPVWGKGSGKPYSRANIEKIKLDWEAFKK